MSDARPSPSFDPLVEYYPPSLREKHGMSMSVDAEPDLVAQEVSADIGWVPDADKFAQRTADRKNKAPPEVVEQIPKGWPAKVKHPLVWKGADLEPRDYVYRLTEGDVSEINSALSAWKARSLDLSDINKSTFPLPTLGPRLHTLCASVHEGIGFCIVRGLDAKSYSREDNAVIYIGVSSYFGEQRGRQYQDGRLMTHITDVKFDDYSDNQRRPLFTSDAQPFHADLLCGVLAFYFLGTAAEGGNMLLASSWKVYNEIAATRPELIEQLAAEDWIHDTFGRQPSHHQRALLHHWKEKLVLVFSRRNLTGSKVTPRSPNIPPMTEMQAEALDAVHFAAAANCVSIKPEVGDMAFMNNFAILHSRSAFRDGGEGEEDKKKRYILRLWLNNADVGWDVPPGLRLGWERIFGEFGEIENYWELDPYEQRDGALYERVHYDDEGYRGRMPGHNGGGGSGGGGGGGSGGGVRSSSCG